VRQKEEAIGNSRLSRTTLARSALIALLAASAMTACGREKLDRKLLALAASTNSVDFGSVLIGQTDEALVTLTNSGDTPLSISEIAGDTLDGAMTALLDEATLGPHESVALRVRFSPTREGEHASEFVIQNTSENQPELLLAVRGSGVDPGPCAGIDCSTPPARLCLNSTTARVYLPNGRCDAGSCVHESSDEGCEFGCRDGACQEDPCREVSCTTPPNDQCYSNTGTCTGGICAYETLTPGRDCSSGDLCIPNATCNEDGDCLGSRVVCTPPAQTCSNQGDGTGLIVRYDQSVGYCNSATGGCEFSQLPDIVCQYGCAGDTCAGDPCVGTPCDDGTTCTIDECVPGSGTYSCRYSLAALADGVTGIDCTIGTGQCNQGRCQVNGTGSGPYAICVPVDGADCTDNWDPGDTPGICTLEDVPGTCIAKECVKDQATMDAITNSQCAGCLVCQECPANGVNGEPWVCW
jgi:hypothetical protein